MFRLLLVALICFISQAAFSQIKYVDLYVSQPNVEDCLTNVETNFKPENFQIFPNPTKGLVNINVNNLDVNTPLQITVLNMNGQTVMSKEVNPAAANFEEQIDLSDHAKGIYMLNIQSKNKYFKAAIILE